MTNIYREKSFYYILKKVVETNHSEVIQFKKVKKSQF